MQPKSPDSLSTPLFFISRRGVQPDIKWAYWVAWQLEEKYGERSCVIQDWDFDPHGNFIKGMQRGATCPFTIAIVSPNYFTSDCTEDEWTAAFKDRKLILLELAPCEAPGLLSPILRVKLHGMEESLARKALLDHMERILAFAKKGRAKPNESPAFPGHVHTSLSPCNVPHPPVKHFVRPGIVWKKLQDLMLPEFQPPSNRHVCVLCGLHGTGKTQAACAFAWEHRSKYSALLWVRGDSKEVLRASFGDLCGVEALDLPEQTERDAEKRVLAVKRWLKEHPGWLLIADNIDTDEVRDALLEWVSPSFAGTVLATSCLSDWPPICGKIEFGSWHFSLCAEFFIARLNLPRVDWPIAAFVGDLFGGLPVALEQAAAYMEQTRTSLELYLPKLLADLKGELDRRTPGSTNYPVSFTAVLKQSLLRLTPEARFFLELAAFLASRGQFLRIYEVIISNSAPDRVKKHGIQCPLVNAETHVMELNRWSLVRQRGIEFDIHTLVQAVIRNSLLQAEKTHRLNVLWRLFFLQFGRNVNPNDSRYWNEWRAVFPHMEAFAQQVRESGDRRALGYLVNHMGLFLESQGLHTKAVTLLSEAVELAKATVGPEHPDTAAALSNLGELLISIGRPAEAKPRLLEAIAIIKKSKPLVSHGESSCWNNLGLCHHALGEREAAEAAFRKALALDSARGGSDDDFGLIHQSNLAMLLDDNPKQKEETEEIYRNVVAKMKDAVRLAAALTNLGALLYRTERAPEAVTVLERAIEILPKYFPPNHPKIKETALHLALARKKASGG